MKNMYKGNSAPLTTQQAQPGPHAQPAGTSLTDEAIASLRFMIGEEKMAGDLYEAFYEQTGLTVFARIAASEDRHLEALLKQADRLGVTVDDIIALPAGEYGDPALSDLYANLLATGSLSAEAALMVGQQVELADIADLNETMLGLSDTALVGVYSKLLAGSENHLDAFNMLLG